MDEKELIIKTRKGDKEAFGELVRIYQKKVFFIVYRLIGNHEDALELTQDVFLAAFRAIKGFRLKSSFYTWIYRIAVNLAYRKLRSTTYKTALKTKSIEDSGADEDGCAFQIPAAGQSDPSQELLAKEEKEIIHRGLASLKRKFYQAVVLYDLEKLSYKEIAGIQRCSLGTVMSRLFRGRLQLAEILKKSGINSP